MVDARVDSIRTNNVRGGVMLLYRLSYNLNGKKDSCYLSAKGIYKKDTNQPFYFQVGDSIKVKPARNPDYYFSTKYLGVIRLVERDITK